MASARQLLLGAAVFLAAIGPAKAQSPPFASPQFLLPDTEGASDYRPVLNHVATAVVFERTIKGATQLYKASLPGGAAEPFTGIAGSTRADWCWRRSAGRLWHGPIAFSADAGVYVASPNGVSPMLLPNTAGMIYPTWYPDCRTLATDGSETHEVAKIDANTGAVIDPSLGQAFVWTGFAAVNQAKPHLLAVAGQNNEKSSYYNQELNYIWLIDGSFGRARMRPLDQRAPDGPSFVPMFQARAGTWSPDGKWFAFESNRVCDNVGGLTYAIFIQDSAGAKPAMQVTDCSWNVQHAKWFPPGPNGVSTMLVAAVAHASASATEPFRIGSLDVSAFVGQ
jgi:hypothetical protein